MQITITTQTISEKNGNRDTNKLVIIQHNNMITCHDLNMSECVGVGVGVGVGGCGWVWGVGVGECGCGCG
jgi:hypothetical protein